MHVLEHVGRVDQVERPVGQQLQVVPHVQVVLATVPEPIEAFRRLDHRRCDVDAIHALEPVAERLGQASDPAAEIQRTARQQRPADVVFDQAERAVDLGPPVGEERLGVPATSAGARMGQDRPHRISLAEHVPRMRQRVEVGRGSGVRRRLVAAEPAEPTARCATRHRPTVEQRTEVVSRSRRGNEQGVRGELARLDSNQD